MSSFDDDVPLDLGDEYDVAGAMEDVEDVAQLPLTSIPDGLAPFVEGTLQDYLTAGDAHAASRWCSRWAEHPEAVHRLMAIFTEWRGTVADGTGALHVFIRDVLDYHLPYLVDKDRGAFRDCGREHTPHRRFDAG